MIQCNEKNCSKTAVVYETKLNTEVYFCGRCYLRKEQSKPVTHRSSIQAVKQDKLVSF